MQYRRFLVIAVLATILYPCLGLADEGFIGRWWRMPATASKINLTEQEKARLDQLYLANRQNLIDIKATMDKERLALEDIMSKEPLNEAKATEQFRRLEKVRAVMSEERFKYFLEVRKVLGAERFQKLTAMVKERWKNRAGRDNSK